MLRKCSLQMSWMISTYGTLTFNSVQSLTVTWRRSLSHRNKSIDLLCESMNWPLYDRDLRHERVNVLWVAPYWISVTLVAIRHQLMEVYHMHLFFEILQRRHSFLNHCWLFSDARIYSRWSLPLTACNCLG